MNFAGNDSPFVICRIETVALCQKMIERPRGRRKYFASSPIPSAQHSASRATMRTCAVILDPSITLLARHSRTKIRQVKPGSRDCHGDGVPGIQAEEPYSRLAIDHDVSPHIQFRKCREPRQRGRSAQPHAGHAEGHNSQPCLPFVSIDLQFRGNMPSQCRLFHAPMRKEQIVPALCHDPVGRRRRPGPVCYLIKICAHQSSLLSLDTSIPPIYPSLSLVNRILGIQISQNSANSAKGGASCNARHRQSGKAA
jgi:hypothetical protein